MWDAFLDSRTCRWGLLIIGVPLMIICAIGAICGS